MLKSISIENFIKSVYLQSQIPDADTRLGSIAGRLEISNAAATDMARKLADRQLVHYTKYKPLTLTSSGKELALNVIRKHRLWEMFLFKTLGLSLHEIHREAEHLEHLTSDFLADKIDNYLGNPTVDPHGDPIPSSGEEAEEDSSQIILTKATAGKDYEICRLFSSNKDFFDFCQGHHLMVGSIIFIEKQHEAIKMTELNIDRERILLNKEFTDNIYVQPIISKA